MSTTANITTNTTIDEDSHSSTLWKDVWLRMCGNRMALLGYGYYQ